MANLVYTNYKNPFCIQVDTSERGLGAVLYQAQDDGMSRAIGYASRTLSKSEKNYDAHILEFQALKWAVIERFHGCPYQGDFEAFTNNNPITYILTMARSDVTHQRWVVSLANCNFKLHCKSGKLNLEVDVFSQIPWEQEGSLHTLDTVLVKAIINRGCSGDCSIPKISPHAIPVLVKNFVVDGTMKLSKQDWKKEKQANLNIWPVIDIINEKVHLQYVAWEGDPSGMWVLLKYQRTWWWRMGCCLGKLNWKGMISWNCNLYHLILSDLRQCWYSMMTLVTWP